MLTALLWWAVAGAQLAETCQWPSVATYRIGETKCTATLVEPRVVVTAAHCLEAGDPGRMRFGEDFSPYAVRVDVEACFVQADYFETRSPKDDYAACVLAEPLTEIPILPIAMGCDVEALAPGAITAIVGFGLPALGEDFGLKHWATTTVTERGLPPELIEVGDETVNGCLGDSGGPGFVQLPDQTWRTFGILAAGPPCGEGPSLYVLLHRRIAWLEEQTGIDLTPCHDADGTWNPGPGCADFSLDPIAEARWDDHCQAPRHTPTSTCPEPNPTDGEDDDGPVQPEVTDDPADPTPDSCACSHRGGPRRFATLLALCAVWRRRQHA